MAHDFEYTAYTDTWTHPDSGVTIHGEDMPDELIPACWRPHD